MKRILQTVSCLNLEYNQRLLTSTITENLFSINHPLTLVFNPSNPVATIRNMTGLGNKELVAGMIDKVNMLVDGGELVQVN